MAGLPVTYVERLHCPRSAACLDEILALDEWLSVEAVAISDALHGVIGALAEPDLKPRLVGLRRVVFRGDRQAMLAFDSRTREALSPELADRIRGLAEHLQERDTLCGRLRLDLQADAAVAADALREIVSDRTMLLGLVYSSAPVFKDALRWLAKLDGRPADKTAVRLAKYVSRAATKTSPLTLFTSSGLGSWREDGPVLALRDPAPQSVVELGISFLYEVIGGLAKRPVSAGRMLVRVNPTAALDGDLVRFVLPGVTGTTRSVRLSPAVGALLRNLDQEYTLGELRRWLSNHATNAEHAARIAEFVDRLLRIGLLELYLPIPDQSLEPRALLGWLDKQADDMPDENDLDQIRATLQHLVRYLDGYATSAIPEERLAHREHIEVAVAEIVKWSGAQLGPRRRTSAPRFYENAIMAGESMVANVWLWKAALDDLAVIAKFGELFDPSHLARLLLPAFVIERYGEGARIPFLRFYAAYEAELLGKRVQSGRSVDAEELHPIGALLRFVRGASETGGSDLERSSVPSLRRLSRLRLKVSGLLSAQAGPLTKVIKISTDELRTAATDYPDLIHEMGVSLACYVQPYLHAGELRLVLNRVLFGMGSGRTRIRHLIRKAGGDLAIIDVEDEPSAGSSGPIYVEIESACGSSLNQRDRAVEHVLAYAGTVSGRPERCRILLSDLTIVQDPTSQRVWLEWTKTGREVLPVHLGLLAIPLLPPVLHFLVTVFGRASYTFAPPLLTYDEITGRPSGDPSHIPMRVESWPRVEVGRVALRRAGWWVPSNDVPRRAPGEEDSLYLLKVARWRRRVGIPERCFTRVFRRDLRSSVAGASGPSQPGEDSDDKQTLLGTWMSKARKPLYVDFNSWHLVRVFERMVGGGTADLMIEEVLPELVDVPRTESGERRVVELIVETPSGQ